jgi:putative ABC transport system permease protein
MLMGDRGKYVGMIIGIAFASLLISQQASIFCGLMLRTSSQIRDVHGAEIWVMDPNLQFVDDIKPLNDNDVYRVRGVPGVKWAVRLYKELNRAKLHEGNYQQVLVLGIDDASMVGAPRDMVLGSLEDLRRPNTVIVDDAGYDQLWPGEPYKLGRTFEMNDRRAVLVGICRTSRTFMTFPVIYTRFSQAMDYARPDREIVSFILAEPQAGLDPREVCRQIDAQTGLRALTRQDFSWVTLVYFMEVTAIPVNFALTVLLGFIVGTAVTALTFHMFTIDNLKQFGTLKALGTSNARLMGLILQQALLVGVVGFGIGIGLTAAFGEAVKGAQKLAFYMPWHVFVGTGAAVMLMLMVSSFVSARRVLVLQPVVVFQG